MESIIWHFIKLSLKDFRDEDSKENKSNRGIFREGRMGQLKVDEVLHSLLINREVKSVEEQAESRIDKDCDKADSNKEDCDFFIVIKRTEESKSEEEVRY